MIAKRIACMWGEDNLKCANGCQNWTKMNLDSTIKSKLIAKGADTVWFCLYLVLRISKRNTECLHGSDHCLHGCVNVLVDQFGIALLVLSCVSSSMDNPHLFDKGALSTLSSTCWIHQQLNPIILLYVYTFSIITSWHADLCYMM